jgi:hypothetical protein
MRGTVIDTHHLRGRRRAPSAAAAAASLLALALVLAPRAARAQSSEAERQFVEAEAALAAGKVAEACALFEASNRIEPRAGTLVNLGLCREKLGQLGSALEAFRAALTRVKDPKKKQVAVDRIAALEPRASSIMISVPREARVAGLVVSRDGRPVDAADWGRAVAVDGGSYEIAATAPGHQRWSTTVRVAPQSDRASVSVPRLGEDPRVVEARTAEARARAAEPRVTEPRVREPRTRAPRSSESRTKAPAPSETSEREGDRAPAAAAGAPWLTSRRKLGLGFAVVGLGAIGGGIALGRSAGDLERDAFALCPEPSTPCGEAVRAQDLLAQGNERALLANVAYAVGGAALVTAVVLLATGGGAEATEDAPALTVIPHAGGAGIALGRRF